MALSLSHALLSSWLHESSLLIARPKTRKPDGKSGGQTPYPQKYIIVDGVSVERLRMVCHASSPQC